MGDQRRSGVGGEERGDRQEGGEGWDGERLEIDRGGVWWEGERVGIERSGVGEGEWG